MSMSADPAQEVSRDVLTAYLAQGEKPSTAWRIGTEHEKFPFYLSDRSPVPYEGPCGIQAMLEGLERFGWRGVHEDGRIIALEDSNGSPANISLEPGGQFELSGAPLEVLHQTCDEVHTHLAQVKEVGEELGIGFLGMGFTPDWRREVMPVMPKERYAIMTRYMGETGQRGRDMMYRSCTVQVNLDFSSEADMVKKFRVALALQPVATALFANSPFVDGRPASTLSTRSAVWLDTDAQRTGMLPFVFEEGFGYELYVDYALQVPMYFVYRNGHYHDVTGKSFADFMQGTLEGFEGQIPTLEDWSHHLTTIFPEVRLKKFLEMRGADSGPWSNICALPALWTGLLYEPDVLDAAWDMVRDWTQEEREALRLAVPVHGLQTPFRRSSVKALARQMLDLAREGLRRRGRGDGAGADERLFLASLEETLTLGQTPAERLLALYHGRWNGSVAPIYEEFAF